MNFAPFSWRKRSWPVLGFSGLLLCSSPLFANSSTIDFAKSSYEFDAESLQPSLQELKQDEEAVVQIQSNTADLRKKSLPLHLEEVRALRIFKALAGAGIDPARLTIVAGKKVEADRVIVVVAKGSFEKTAAITPAPQTEAVGEFTLNFDSGSAIPLPYDESSFQLFLQSVGQANRDALVIEGYTDSVGNADYNRTLGELRALRVFELLARKGLPPYRVDAKSIFKSSTPGAGKDAAADRKVVVRWTQNAEVAAVAQKMATPPPPPPPPPEPVPAPVVAPEPPPEKPVIKKTRPMRAAPQKSTLDLIFFAGSLMPLGDFAGNAKPAGNFGLGVGKMFLRKKNRAEIRATFFASAVSKLDAKESSRSGPVKLGIVSTRADYVWGGAMFRPYVGLGLGLYRWNARIHLVGTDLSNSNSHNDIGAQLMSGVSIDLRPNLFLEPELTWNKIGGDFSSSLLDVQLALRWRI